MAASSIDTDAFLDAPDIVTAEGLSPRERSVGRQARGVRGFYAQRVAVLHST